MVEAGDGWSQDPFSGHVEDGKMYGRGTSDMKGGLQQVFMQSWKF